MKTRKLKKLRKRTTFKEDIAKMLFEIGRVALAGIVISVLLRGELIDDTLMKVGSAAAVACFILSLLLGLREIKGESSPFRKKKRRRR